MDALNTDVKTLKARNARKTEGFIGKMLGEQLILDNKALKIKRTLINPETGKYPVEVSENNRQLESIIESSEKVTITFEPLKPVEVLITDVEGIEHKYYIGNAKLNLELLKSFGE